MKFILVIAVVLVAFYVWRSSRIARRPPPAAPRSDPAKVVEMASCDLCGVHCAVNDLVVGRRGAYCTTQHRAQAEP